VCKPADNLGKLLTRHVLLEYHCMCVCMRDEMCEFPCNFFYCVTSCIVYIACVHACHGVHLTAVHTMLYGDDNDDDDNYKYKYKYNNNRKAQCTTQREIDCLFNSYFACACIAYSDSTCMLCILANTFVCHLIPLLCVLYCMASPY